MTDIERTHQIVKRHNYCLSFQYTYYAFQAMCYLQILCIHSFQSFLFPSSPDMSNQPDNEYNKHYYRCHANKHILPEHHAQ